MLATVKETATILGVSPRRVCFLLSQNRIQGAFKAGHQWLIPLCDGKPIIDEGKRGPKPRWSKRLKNPRKQDLTVIKVIRQNIDSNEKNQTHKTVISVKRGQEPAIQGYALDIYGPSRICYSPEARKDKGGARVWLETYFDVKVWVDEDCPSPLKVNSR
jgi:hypothetical protein